MRRVKKGLAERFKNAATCAGVAYPLGSRRLNIATVRLTDRYPLKGRVTNLRCAEIAYVTAGSGKVVIEGRTVRLHKGDAVLIEPRERYYWNGRLVILTACAPAWSLDQHKYVR